MKKILYMLLATAMLVGCEKQNEFDGAQRNTVNEDGSIEFEELFFLMSLKVSDSTFLVARSIDSVSIYVDGSYWAKTTSDTVDTARISQSTIGNMNVTLNKFNYLVRANQDIAAPEAPTAGDFANYLNALNNLKPGEHACFIESFQVTFNDNTTKTYYPMSYHVFEIDENDKSAYVGEFEFKIQ